MLQHSLLRAFDLSGRNFDVSYGGRDGLGRAVYLSLLLDWDLGTAFALASRPHLQLRVDVGRAGEDPLLDGWDVVSPADVQGPDALLPPPPAAPAALLLLSQVGRTLSKVQQVLSGSWGRETRPFRPPPGEAELRTYLDPEGRLSNPEQLRLPSTRAAWSPRCAGRCGRTC